MIEQLEKAMSLYNTLLQQADHATTEQGAVNSQRAADQQLQTASAIAQVVQAHMLRRIADALETSGALQLLADHLENITTEIAAGNPH